MRGDLLFYTPKDWLGRLVAGATHGPFCHVAVDLGKNQKIEATWNGVVRVALYPTARSVVRFQLPSATPHLDAAIDWLFQQVGEAYGREDILNQALRLAGFHFYFGQPDHYDCSDLAACFLLMTGAAVDLGAFAQNTHLITPNDLARCCGLLSPPQKA